MYDRSVTAAECRPEARGRAPGSSARKAEFAEQLARHHGQLLGYIYSLVRDLDDAEDLFQQTSLVLWDKFDQFDRSRSFVAWACGVARYEVTEFPAQRGAATACISATSSAWPSSRPRRRWSRSGWRSGAWRWRDA